MTRRRQNAAFLAEQGDRQRSGTVRGRGCEPKAPRCGGLKCNEAMSDDVVVVTPVGLQEDAVDLLEVDNFYAVTHGFQKASNADVANAA